MESPRKSLGLVNAVAAGAPSAMVSPQSPRKAFGRVKDGCGSFQCVHNGSPASPSQTTLVGEVVFGWGGSPVPSPRAEVEVGKIFSSAAGKRAGRVEYRPLSKCRVQEGLANSAVDLLSYRGADLGPTGPNPHLEPMAKFDEYAGLRNGEKAAPSREVRQKQGVPLSLSVIDQVVFGHDIDGSGDAPHERFTEMNSDHAGVRREERFRHARPGLPMKSTAEAVLYGKEEGSSGSQTARLMSENAAGLRPGERMRGRKAALQMMGTVDEVVFNKANPSAMEAEHYSAAFGEHAGKHSRACILRMASAPARHFATMGTRSPTASLAEGSELGSEEPQQAEAAAGPPARLPEALGSPVPGGSRCASSASSCTTASRQTPARAADRKLCLDDAGSFSSRGSLGARPRWR